MLSRLLLGFCCCILALRELRGILEGRLIFECVGSSLELDPLGDVKRGWNVWPLCAVVDLGGVDGGSSLESGFPRLVALMVCRLKYII